MEDNIEPNELPDTGDEAVSAPTLPPPDRGELIILLAAAISIEVFALLTLAYQVAGWDKVSGWGWLGALVQAGLLLGLALVTPLLGRELWAKLNQAVADESTSNPLSTTEE